MHQEQTPLPAPVAEQCRPRRRWVMVGAAITAALLIVSLLFGRAIYDALMARLDARTTDTLISVIDVFSCCILTWKALTVMIPAFLLGGAIAAFLPTGLVLKYLGARSNQVRAYATAALCGPLLSLCSCNIVPLFVSIYRRGAGIGPAFTFLFAGPAINVLAATFTIQIIGVKLGMWRIIGTPIIGVVIGLLMTLLYRKEARRQREEQAAMMELPGGMERRLWLLFITLLVIVVFGSWQSDIAFGGPTPESKPAPGAWVPLAVGLTLLVAALVVIVRKYFSREERQAWLGESWHLVKLVVPVLLPAVLAIGAIATFVDIRLVYHLVGSGAQSESLWGMFRPILIGAAFGELMYFPILTEVAFVKAFLKLGMEVGPALALLIAGPGSSLPGFIIIARAIGWKKAAIYELLVILVTAVYAALFASRIGEYICSCMMN